jgi:uncharacterized HAD superfamily protein
MSDKKLLKQVEKLKQQLKDSKILKKASESDKPKKKVEFRGKNISYVGLPDLKVKLGSGITSEEAKNLIKGKNLTRYITDNMGNVQTIDISKKPLLLSDFGINRITNKQLLSDSSKIKNVNISKNLDSNVKLTIKLEFQVRFSDDFLPKQTKTFFRTINPNDITTDYLEDYVKNEYLSGVSPQEIKIIKYEITSTFSNQKLKLVNSPLRDSKPLSIDNIYNEVITNENWKDCVIDYLHEKYNKKISEKAINKLSNVNGVSTNEIYKFAVDYNIKMIAYDINGDVIKSNYPSKKSHKSSLIYIAYNNHLYPLKNTYLSKKNIDASNIVFVKDGNKELINQLNNSVLPSNIKMNDDIIISFQVEKTKYICNKEYQICKLILGKFGLEDKIYDTITLKSIGKIIEKVYTTDSCQSFFPYSSKFKKGGFSYVKKSGKIDINDKSIKTIDKNKCYPFVLSKLKYLLNVDIRTSKFIQGEQELKENWLYIVEPSCSSILLPDTNVYYGEHLIKCRVEGLEFKIIEGLECEMTNNYYNQMVIDLKNKIDSLDNINDILEEFNYTSKDKFFKSIMNIMIGQFECDVSEKKYQKFDRIVNNDEIDMVSGYKTRLNTNYWLVFQEQIKQNIYNKKPIAIQIKDDARFLLYNAMKKLGLTEEDIIHTNTDSISFLCKNDKYKDLLSDALDGWKEINNNITSQPQEYYNETLSFINTNNNNNILGDCYAGCGKSYKIMNEIIPTLNNDYIVLTPSHCSVKEYNQSQKICDVIQKYEYSGELPKQNNIIVDEFGMCSRKAHNFLFECYLNKKRIICFGDFKQLLPVKESRTFSSELYIKMMFNEIVVMTDNHRNNFTKEYYDSLINKKVNLEKEVKKYSTENYYDSNLIICYRNDTCDMYNKLMCERLNIKSLCQVGAKIICKSNKLHEHGIYNGFVYTVKSVCDAMIEIDDGLFIKAIDINEYFKFAYAQTLHSIQGQSIEKIYYAPEDYIYLDGRTAYTIISRIKNTF